MPSLVTLDEAAALGLPSAATKNADQPTLQLLLDAAIAEAMASGLYVRYGTNITAVDASVKQRIADIWSWRVLKHRGFNPDNKSDASAKSGYTDAIAWFTDVGGGLIHPVVTTDGAAPSALLPDLQSNPSRGWKEWATGFSSGLPEEEI